MGWMAARDRALAAAVRESAPGVLHLTTARAAAWLYAAYARSPEGRLLYPERHRALRELPRADAAGAGGEARAHRGGAAGGRHGRDGEAGACSWRRG